MDHEERLRRFNTNPESLAPETRERNEQLRRETQAKRDRGETVYIDEHHRDVPEHRPVSDEQQ